MFYCGYLLHPALGGVWHPANSKLMVAFEGIDNRVVIHVDPGRPDAWRREPYYSSIKQWATLAFRCHGQVLVYRGKDVTVVFPNSEKNIGEVRPDQAIMTFTNSDVFDPLPDAIVVDRDDPRIAQATEVHPSFNLLRDAG